MHLQLGQHSHIIVSSPEYAKEIMKTHGQIFANRPRFLASDISTYNNIDIVFAPCGNYWRQLRKICTLELFSTKRVQSFRRIREEEVSALVRNISEQEGFVINLGRKIMTLTNSIAARTVFGKKTENVEHILEIMEQSMKIGSGLSISDLYPSLKFISVTTGMRARIMNLHKDGDKVFDDVIRDHKEKKRNNVGEDRMRRILLMFFLGFRRMMTLRSPYLLTTLKLFLKLLFVYTLIIILNCMGSFSHTFL